MTNWLRPDPNGLFCEPGGFYIDPARPVSRALITHGQIILRRIRFAVTGVTVSVDSEPSAANTLTEAEFKTSAVVAGRVKMLVSTSI